jgi:hypothetical protein
VVVVFLQFQAGGCMWFWDILTPPPASSTKEKSWELGLSNSKLKFMI